MFRSLLFFITILLVSMGLHSGCSKPPGQHEFDLGTREIKRNNYVRAKALFEKSITKRPASDENAMAYNYIGIACGKLGQYQEAVEAFEDSRRLSPTLVEPVYNLGVLMKESGDASQAIKFFEEAARMNAEDARPLESLGEIYIQRQQWPEARRVLYAALERAPNSARIYTSLALVELHADSPQKAVATLMKALEKNSKYPPALFNLGYIYQNNLNDLDQSLAYFKKYVSVDPKGEHVDYAREALKKTSKKSEVHDVVTTEVVQAESEQPTKNSFDQLVQEATGLAQKGEEQRALYLFLQAAGDAARENKKDLQEQALQSAAKLCFDQPRAHYELGRFLLEKGKADAALKSFKQATVLNRDYAPAYLGMGEAALRSGEFDAALIGYKQAVKADPKNPDALWALATLYDERLGLSENAAKSYREFEKNFPNDPRVLKAKERADKLAPIARPAKTSTEPALRSDPTKIARESKPIERLPLATAQLPYKKSNVRNAKAAVQAFNRGALYQQQQNWESAIYYYLRAVENDDSLTSAFYNLGIVYGLTGDKNLAKAAYLRALELQPELTGARYNLAVLYHGSGDFAAAQQLLQEIIKSKPDYAQAYYVLGLIYSEAAKTHKLAKENFETFLKLAPNDPAARFAQQWVKSH